MQAGAKNVEKMTKIDMSVHDDRMTNDVQEMNRKSLTND